MMKIKYLLPCMSLLYWPCYGLAAPDSNATTRSTAEANDTSVVVKPASASDPRRRSLRESLSHGGRESPPVVPARQLSDRELRELRLTIRAQRRDND